MSTEPSNPDYVIVDAGQLLYHIVWPSDGQGWGRLQKPDYDYDYDYSAHKIIDYDSDYDYSGD